VSPAITAFVLGGGGHRGAYEVGMLKALVEYEVEPGLIVGTSIGAINGALFAASPDKHGVAVLERAWKNLKCRDLFPPDGTAVYVLPTGAPAGKYNDPSKLRYGDLSKDDTRIAAAFEATSVVLEQLSPRG
jgi:predicted acylesterase/phospholipase RssA